MYAPRPSTRQASTRASRTKLGGGAQSQPRKRRPHTAAAANFTHNSNHHHHMHQQPPQTDATLAALPTNNLGGGPHVMVHVDKGPPPNLTKRQLIFDSLSKIVRRNFGDRAAHETMGGSISSPRGHSNDKQANADENAAYRDELVRAGATLGTYVWTWGAGYHGQIGFKFQRGAKKYATSPKLLEVDRAVRQVACGGLHTAAITDSGAVYMWGDARMNQLGYNPIGFTNQPTPRIVTSLAMTGVFITQIACGQGHTVAISDKGMVFSWGHSKSGQCGHGDRQPVRVPKKIALLQGLGRKFTQVSCGDKHTVALASSREVFTWGCGEHGQLGHGDQGDVLAPKRLESLCGVVQTTSVVCGSMHTCFVSEEGALYICGFGEHFYANEEQNFLYSPLKIPFDGCVVQAATGQNHVLVLDDKGDVYAWGTGSYGQIGHGTAGNLSTPRLVLPGKKIAQIAAGRYHSAALNTYGMMYTWGCGENGQLGQGSDENLCFPTIIEHNIGTVVGQISCGEHHTAILTSTPWTRVAPDVERIVRAEREEGIIKTKMAKKANHGLFRKDLMRVRDTMRLLKAQWMDEERRQQEEADIEQRKDVQSVLGSNAIRSDIHRDVARRGGDFAPGGGGSGRVLLPRPLSLGKISMGDGASLDVASGGDVDNDYSERPRTVPSGAWRRGGIDKSDSSARKRPGTSMATSQRFGASSGSASSSLPLVRGAIGEEADGGSFGEQKHYWTAEQQLRTDCLKTSAQQARTNFLKESAQLVKRVRRDIARKGTVTTVHGLNALTKEVFAYRKEYDLLKNRSNTQMKKLVSLRRALRTLHSSTDGVDAHRQHAKHRLKALEMKLNTVQIKINETEQNRKTYSLNIVHLKEEELERMIQLESLRKQSSENDAYVAKMNEVKLQALEERERAEQDLVAFQQEIQQFQRFFSQQMSAYTNISAINQSRAEKRDFEKTARYRKRHEKVVSRIQTLTEEMKEKSAEASAMSAQLESANERLRYFEKRFQQIVSATGLTNPEAIINKFSLKEQIKKELRQEVADKEKRIQKLTADREELSVTLRAAKSNFVDNRWKDVTEMEERVRTCDAGAGRKLADIERTVKQLTAFQEGLLSLQAKLPPELAGVSAVDPDALEASASLDDPLNYRPDLTLNVLQAVEDHVYELANTVMRGEIRERERRLHEAELNAKRREHAMNIFGVGLSNKSGQGSSDGGVGGKRDGSSFFNVTNRYAGVSNDDAKAKPRRQAGLSGDSSNAAAATRTSSSKGDKTAAAFRSLDLGGEMDMPIDNTNKENVAA